MFAVAAALSACVTFSNGLVDSPLPVDGRLIGYWQVAYKADQGTLLIEADGSSTISAILADAACTKVERFSATRTEIAGHDFLDTSGVEQEGKPVWLGPVGYEFPDSNHLLLFLPDPKLFEQAVMAGELSGKVSEVRSLFGHELKNGIGYKFLTIDSSTADLRGWISLHPDAVHLPIAGFERRELSQAPRCADDRK